MLGYSILTFSSGPSLRLERIDPYHYTCNLVKRYNEMQETDSYKTILFTHYI